MLALICCVGCNEKPQRMPIMVEPWYNCDPLTIQVGKFSDRLKSEDVAKLQLVAEDIRTEIDQTPIEALYVLAIRLYDVGQKEDAIYWFYTAEFRSGIYMEMIEETGGVGDAAFESKQAQIAFSKILGEPINSYAIDVSDKFIKILETVDKEGVQSGYIGLAYPKLSFKPETMQAEIVKEVAVESTKLRQFIIDNRERIERACKENVTDGKNDLDEKI